MRAPAYPQSLVSPHYRSLRSAASGSTSWQNVPFKPGFRGLPAHLLVKRRTAYPAKSTAHPIALPVHPNPLANSFVCGYKNIVRYLGGSPTPVVDGLSGFQPGFLSFEGGGHHHWPCCCGRTRRGFFRWFRPSHFLCPFPRRLVLAPVFLALRPHTFACRLPGPCPKVGA
jgi:hypothetical protein